MTLLTLASFSLISCDGGDGGTDAVDTGDGASERTESYFINTTVQYEGDNTCQGTDFGTPDPAKQVDVTFNGEVHDFQESDDTVDEATVQIWHGDDITGTPDETLTADVNGAFTTTLKVCTPIAYGTSTPPEWEETVDTFEVHQIFGYDADGVVDEWINSVSQATSQIIPAVIGIQWDESTGIVAGTAYDCDGGVDGETEFFGNAQVLIRDADGNIPQTADIFYFDDLDLPTSKLNQPQVNPINGLWVAVNVPVGQWIVEMKGYNGTDYDLLGTTVLDIRAGSVNISNIYAGKFDGISYPKSCLAE